MFKVALSLLALSFISLSVFSQEKPLPIPQRDRQPAIGFLKLSLDDIERFRRGIDAAIKGSGFEHAYPLASFLVCAGNLGISLCGLGGGFGLGAYSFMRLHGLLFWPALMGAITLVRVGDIYKRRMTQQLTLRAAASRMRLASDPFANLKFPEEPFESLVVLDDLTRLISEAYDLTLEAILKIKQSENSSLVDTVETEVRLHQHMQLITVNLVNMLRDRFTKQFALTLKTDADFRTAALTKMNVLIQHIEDPGSTAVLKDKTRLTQGRVRQFIRYIKRRKHHLCADMLNWLGQPGFSSDN